MGFFEGLDQEQYDRQYSDRQLVGRIIPYFRVQAKRIAVVTGMVLLIAVLAAVQPMLVSRGVDLLRIQPNLSSILLLGLAVLLLGVLIWVANWFSRRAMTRAVADIVLALAKDAFRAATSHDLSFYDQYSSGKVVSRITSDTRDFGQLFGLLTDFLSQVVESGLLAIVLMTIEWRLALGLFALIPIVFLLGISYRSLARKVTKQGMRAMANVNSTIKETVSGIAVAKNFRQEESIYAEFEQANRKSYQVNVRRGLVLAIIFPTINTLGGITTAVLVYTGGISVAQGLVSFGAWYLFLLSLDRFLFPIMNLSSFWTTVQNGLSAAERVFALIDATPVVKQTEQHKVTSLRGEVEFEHVNFQYKENEPVLDDFSLKIAPGETVALVGHTGAGKSSIAKLTARFYEFQTGRILIDGQDIRSLDLDTYRKQLGIVSQVPFLFSGSVVENIRYARPEIAETEIAQLASQIGEGEWLETLPQGLETQVGERGGRLSMGQRQLVSLMRVLVQKPAIFILDEATASIDPFTEWQIQQALNLILRQTTSILIAHRLSTIKSADRIVVIENGGIIEMGKHASLMEQNGHYAGLYNMYFRHQSLAYVEQARKLADIESAPGKIG
jgi:ATP-binding cassette subfamily B protein